MFPRWLSWLFVLFLGYIVVTGNRGITQREEAPEKAAREAQIAEYYPALHALVDGDRWKRAINPAYTDERPCAPLPKAEGRLGSYAILEERGTGDAAECGGTIRLNAQYWDAKDASAKTSDTVALTLGAQPGLDALLVGMTFGETRTLVLPVPEEGYEAFPAWKPDTVQLLTVTRVSDRETPAIPAEEEANEERAAE